jgi:hypothetical protein
LFNSNTLDPRVYRTPAIDAPGAVEVEVLFRNANVTHWVSAGNFTYTQNTEATPEGRTSMR